MRSRALAATAILCLAVCPPASSHQNQVPAGTPRIGFAPIGTPFGSSAAYSYLAGKPVLRLPNGLTVDPYNTGAGYTLYDPAQQQQSQERYQVQSAQTAEAYREQMMMRQKAMARATEQQNQSRAMRQGFDPKTGAPRKSGKAAKETPVFDESGKPVLPDYAAKNQRRTDAETAIAAVQAEAKSNGSASVATIVKAKEALRAYGVPAIKSVPKGSRILSERLREQLIRIDQSLDAFAEPAAEEAN